MKKLRQRVPLAAVVLTCAAWWSAPLSAADAEKSFTARGVLEDAKLYFTAPIRWDMREWLYFGGSLAAVAVAHQYDDNVREHFVGDSASALDNKDSNDLRDALPAAAIVAGTFTYAALIHDHDGYNEGWSMVEAAGLSAVDAYALKLIAGRLRPNETTDPDSWGDQGDSFPSMHSTAAFAIGTVLAESGSDRYRWVRRGIGYGVAAGTAYLRVHDNVHWFSDTVAGAALGIATANFVLNRHEFNDNQASVAVVPLDGGMMLTYSVPLH